MGVREVRKAIHVTVYIYLRFGDISRLPLAIGASDRYNATSYDIDMHGASQQLYWPLMPGVPAAEAKLPKPPCRTIISSAARLRSNRPYELLSMVDSHASLTLHHTHPALHQVSSRAAREPKGY